MLCRPPPTSIVDQPPGDPPPLFTWLLGDSPLLHWLLGVHRPKKFEKPCLKPTPDSSQRRGVGTANIQPPKAPPFSCLPPLHFYLQPRSGTRWRISRNCGEAELTRRLMRAELLWGNRMDLEVGRAEQLGVEPTMRELLEQDEFWKIGNTNSVSPILGMGQGGS